MNSGQYVLKQVLLIGSKYEFDKCVNRYKGNYKVQSFTCWTQFVCLVFGQLTHRKSLRDIVTCINSQGSKLYHLGIKKDVRRSTFSKANENRSWQIYRDYAHYLINEARGLFTKDNSIISEMDRTIYALDSTTIDLCLSVFPWTPSSKGRAAVKIHTLMDLKGSIPVWIRVSNGRTSDMKILEELPIESKCFYIMDRGYMHLKQLNRINDTGAYFIIRSKRDINYEVIKINKTGNNDLIISDCEIKYKVYRSRQNYPKSLRAIEAKDEHTQKIITLLTNNFEANAATISKCYRSRWQIELFFKWIKQNLKIERFWGYSKNAVKTQIWTAVATYVLVILIKKKYKSKLSIYEILQILSINTFDKTPVNQLLRNNDKITNRHDDCKQLKIRW